jgi:pyroglutamyl-peptidase
MKLLLTSFDVWLHHQPSNASDDLLGILIGRNLCPKNTHLLRKIAVDFQQAPETAIAALNHYKPEVIVCCGMAENRTLLSLESTARFEQEHLTTGIDLNQVLKGTIATEISHDAGNFVCNHLYYSLLKYIQENSLKSHCLFVHVPILCESNFDQIVQDFCTVLENLWVE